MTKKSTHYIKIAIIVSLNIIIVALSVNLFKIDSVDALSKLGSNSEKVITDSAFQASRDALNGWDPTGGSLYYFNPAKTDDPWMHSRPVIVEIGNHLFCS